MTRSAHSQHQPRSLSAVAPSEGPVVSSSSSSSSAIPSCPNLGQSIITSKTRPTAGTGGGGSFGLPDGGGGGGGTGFTRSQTLTVNQKAALASAYNELGKELGSTRLKAIGNYTLGRTIGQGTFGKVRLGTHRLMGTRVAIKQIPKAHSASLTREIHHHRRLHHDHVMKLYEVLATESSIWMISELCSGGELYDYLVERGTLNEAEARRVFGQLCLAVSYVHGRGIVHRDLKLENILLDERCNVKLGDFGFTREYEGRRLMETFCGTTGYAAPEMLAGKKYTGQEVDIWSLGIILYALLCGSLPFDDDDEHVMKNKILLGKFDLPESLSEEARDLITDILRKDPTERSSIRAILGHAWFHKIMPTSSMETVEEDDTFHIRQDRAPRIYKTSSRPVSPRSSVAPLPANTRDRSTDSRQQKQQKEVDLASSIVSVATSKLATHASDSTSSLVDGESGGEHHTSDSSDVSDNRSGISGMTAPTSVEDASKPVSSSRSKADKDVAADDDGPQPLADRERQSQRPIGMQHRNESQSTIRRNGSSGSEGGLSRQSISKGVKSGGGPRNLPTHHESPGRSGSGASSSADERGAATHYLDDGEQLKSCQPQFSLHLSAGESTSPSRVALHRTPSRTKRRSVSSTGLSDHYPPHLDPNRPIDYLSLLEASQPTLFSSPLEQEVLHQLSNLGMDVGQIVHSILTDACDASAAMWWLLRRKAEERKAAENLLNPCPTDSSPKMTTPTIPSPIPVPAPALPIDRTAVGAANLNELPLDEPPRLHPDEYASKVASLDDLTSSADTALTLGPGSRKARDEILGALTVPFQTSDLRRRVSADASVQTPKTPEGPSAQVTSESLSLHGVDYVGRRQPPMPCSPSPPPSTLKALLASPSSYRPVIKARASSTMPDGETDASPRRKAEPLSLPDTGPRPQPGRQRTSSLGLKLTNALTGGPRKDTYQSDEPEPPLPLLPLAYDKARGPTLATGLGLFNRRASGGLKKMKGAATLQEPLGTAASNLTKEDIRADTLAADSIESRVRDVAGRRENQTSTPASSSKSIQRDQEPSSDGSPNAKTNRTCSPASSKQLPTSNSEDTFSTVYSATANRSAFNRSSTSIREDTNASVQSLSSSSKKRKGKGKSSFLTTVRNWLGTEEKAKATSAGRSPAANARPPIDYNSRSNAVSATQMYADMSAIDTAGSGYAGSREAPNRTSSIRSRSSQYPSGGSIARRGSNRSPAVGRAYQTGRTVRPPGIHGHQQRPSLEGSGVRGPSTPLLEQRPGRVSSPHSTIGRPSYRRRQSAGSITPTGTLYGGILSERPSRAPSTSSLYRAPIASASGMRTRQGSSSSAHSMMLRRQQGSSSYLPQGSGLASHVGASAPMRPYSPMAERMMGEGSLRRGASKRSFDSGTIVRRQRGSVHRPASDSHHSRPPSFMEISEDRDVHALEGEASVEGAQSHGPMMPHTPSIDFGKREGDPSQGHGRMSPTVFLAHRMRQTYKPPSANPALFTSGHQVSRSPSLSRTNSEILSQSGHLNTTEIRAQKSLHLQQQQALPLAGTGMWQRSWGRPPPSWAGPVDTGPSSSFGPSTAVRGRSGVDANAAGAAARASLRDVFADKDEDDWEDEDDVQGEATFSGGLGQLDSTRLDQRLVRAGDSSSIGSSGWRGSRRGMMDSPLRGPRAGTVVGTASNPFVRGNDMRRADSGPGAGATAPLAPPATMAQGRRSPLPSSTSSFPSTTATAAKMVGGGESNTSGQLKTLPNNPLLSGHSRYAGVRNVFQPPALGREIRPKMIAVCEGEGEAEGQDEGGPVATDKSGVNDGAKLEDGEILTSASSAEEALVDDDDDDSPLAAPATLAAPPLATTLTTATRHGGSMAPSFKSNIVEEEEEEEEEEE